MKIEKKVIDKELLKEYLSKFAKKVKVSRNKSVKTVEVKGDNNLILN